MSTQDAAPVSEAAERTRALLTALREHLEPTEEPALTFDPRGPASEGGSGADDQH